MRKLIEIITFIIAGALLSSCISEKKRAEICSTCKTNTIEKEVVKYIDTPIYILDVQTEPIYIPNPCALLCDSSGKLIANVNKTFTNSKGNSITVSSVNGLLFANAKIDSLKKVISVLSTSKQSYVEKEIKIPCNNERTQLDGFFKYSAIIFYILLILFLSLKLIKKYIKS